MIIRWLIHRVIELAIIHRHKLILILSLLSMNSQLYDASRVIVSYNNKNHFI
jgi:hypothetical protein